MFGQDRFCSTLSSLADKNCRQIIEVVKADISDFTTGAEQNDDITILALKRK
jgi:serine phosphatase RsbU (regulator of sigma subunit)